MSEYEVDVTQNTLLGTYTGVVYRIDDEDGTKVRTRVRSTFGLFADRESVIRSARRIVREDRGENVETVPLNGSDAAPA